MRLFELLDKRGQRIQLVGLDGDVFREATSGLIRVIDHELVIWFRPDVPERLRRNILRPHGFVVCRMNAFVPHQWVVSRPERVFGKSGTPAYPARR